MLEMWVQWDNINVSRDGAMMTVTAARECSLRVWHERRLPFCLFGRASAHVLESLSNDSVRFTDVCCWTVCYGVHRA